MEKVFCIGMFKTGTTSVGRAFEMLGLRTFHGTHPILELDNDNFDWSSEKFSAHHTKMRNLTELYDAFEDFPFMWIYRELHAWYPDARFVLTERDSSKVAKSDINMWKQLGKGPIPEPQAFIDRYEKHHASVLDYFGDSKQLLRMTLGTGEEWNELCGFLDLPKPAGESFPRANVRPYGWVGRALYRFARTARDAVRSR